MAGHQVEKGLHNSDWHQWEGTTNQCGRPRIAQDARADDGPDFAHVNPDGTPGGRFVDYIAKAKAMGHNSFRFSLEWSRIQPEAGGPYDPAALRLYHAILAECRKQGLEPMVTLQHFTLPTWVNDVKRPEASLEGWAGPADSIEGQAPIIDTFARFAGDMAKEFAGEVKLWVTLNEPAGYATVNYGLGLFPGKGAPDPKALRRSLINMCHAHARAYDAIKAADPDAQVGLAQHIRLFEPKNPKNPRDVEAAAQLAYIGNALQLDAVTAGVVDWTGETDPRCAGTGGDWLPSLAGRLDFVGINYYTRDKVSALPSPLPFGDFHIKGLPLTQVLTMLPLVGRFFRKKGMTEMDWEIYPQGMHDTLMWAKERFDLPIYVSENGIAETPGPEERRSQFIVDHVAAVQRAVRDGADVRGYLHWSLMDNFEWLEGFRPRFGLLTVDFNDPARPFTETAGARTFSELIRRGGAGDLQVTPERPQRRWGVLAHRARDYVGKLQHA